jgi:glycosyltransferase involved in cell wall biosynthesis
MRIAIDARKLSENKTGIGNYLENMMEEILKQDLENEYYLFSDKPIKSKFEQKNVNYIEINKFRNLFRKEQIYQPFWLNVLLPSYLKKFKIDIFWGPNFVRPLSFSGERSIITVHDLAFIEAKQYHSSLHSLYLRIFLRLSLFGNPKILTVSKYSKETILKHYSNVSDDQVDITYCSYNRNLFTGQYDKDYKEKVRKKHNLPQEYLLFVGTTTARKNLKNVIHAIKYSVDNQKKVCDLVVVGAKGNGLQELKHLVRKFNIEDRVHFLGYVEDRDLPYIYEMANIFVFPSFFEGFGIPILEAMACGTPVITSNLTSLPEVSGDAAYLIDPYSPENIAEAIEEILTNDKVRNEMIVKGYARIKEFCWEKSARVFLKQLEKIQKNFL